MQVAALALAVRVFVLPVSHPDTVPDEQIVLLGERLLVALDDAGLEAIAPGAGVPDAERCKAACIAEQARKARATQVLAVRLLAGEGGALSAFAGLYDAGGAVLRRVEVKELAPEDVAGTLPGRLATFAAGAQPEEPARPLIAVVPPAEPEGVTIAGALAASLAGQLAAWDGVTVGVMPGAEAARSAYVAEIAIDGLSLARRKHHARHYLDGQLVATFTLRAADGTVVFTKQAIARFSRRARKTTAAEAIAALVKEATTQWMSSFRSLVGPESLKGR